MDTKHTPGPWRVGLTIGSAHTTPAGPWGWYQTDIDGPPGEGCFLELRQYHGGETGQANAHLIAAAPDLLEALRDALAYLASAVEEYEDQVRGGKYDEAQADLDEAQNVHAKAIAAIRKAEGE